MSKTRRRRKGYTPQKPHSQSSYSEATKRYDSSYPDSERSSSVKESVQDSKSFKKIRTGLRKSVPAAIIMWAFRKLPSNDGLSSRRIINFLKKHYRVIDNPRKTGKSIGALLRCAVDFGMLAKRGNRYYLPQKSKRDK